MEKLLKLIEQNPRLTDKEIAVMLGMEEKEVTKKIHSLEDGGIIKGYRAIIDEEMVENHAVTAPVSYTHLTLPTKA